MIKDALFVFLGGGMGSVLRYLIDKFTFGIAHPDFPLGTFLVNLIGSFAIGVLWAISEKSQFSTELKFFVFVGILGGFTTFSSFSLGCVNLIKNNHFNIALLYFSLTNLFGISCTLLGYNLMRVLKLT